LVHFRTLFFIKLTMSWTLPCQLTSKITTVKNMILSARRSKLAFESSLYTDSIKMAFELWCNLPFYSLSSYSSSSSSSASSKSSLLS
jgi:hypothetical protein